MEPYGAKRAEVHRQRSVCEMASQVNSDLSAPLISVRLVHPDNDSLESRALAGEVPEIEGYAVHREQTEFYTRFTWVEVKDRLTEDHLLRAEVDIQEPDLSPEGVAQWNEEFPEHAWLEADVARMKALPPSADLILYFTREGAVVRVAEPGQGRV